MEKAAVPDGTCLCLFPVERYLEIEKPAWVSPGGLLVNAGNHLRSHTLTRAVPSAQRGLTSVFGMGTGVTLAIRPPGNWKSKLGSRKLARSFDEQLREVG